MIRGLWARFGRKKEQSTAGENKSKAHNSDIKSREIPIVSRRDERLDLAEISHSPVVMKKDSMERFHEGLNRLVEKLEGIHEHLGRQIHQNEQLLERMNQLPEIMKTVPVSIDRQEQAICGLTEELKNKAARDAEVMEMLSVIPEEAGRQSETLVRIDQKLGQSAESGARLVEHLGCLSETMGKLEQDTLKQTEWIEHMSRAFTVTERHLKYTLARQHQRFLWVLVICLAVCSLAIGGLVAGIVLLRG